MKLVYACSDGHLAVTSLIVMEFTTIPWGIREHSLGSRITPVILGSGVENVSRSFPVDQGPLTAGRFLALGHKSDGIQSRRRGGVTRGLKMISIADYRDQTSDLEQIPDVTRVTSTIHHYI